MNGSKKRIALVSAAALLTVCLFSVIGVTYARLFTTIFSGSINVTALSNNSVYIYANSLDEETVSEEWKDISEGWTLGDGEATLEFFVANGTGEGEYAKRDQNYTVKLIAGLGGENMTVKLAYTDSDGNKQEIVSVPEKIIEGSSLHSSYGDGWIYGFADENGEEVSFFLEGDELSYENFRLTVTGTNELSLLDLRVTGEFAD